MQNMAMQAAANAAGSSASGVAAGATAGAAAAAAQAGVAATVAGAAQSAGIAGAATAGASAAAATAATAAVAVASAAGVGLIGNNATTCAYPNLGYRSGNITMFLEGVPRLFTQRESRLIEDVLVDVYNDASGICADIYQREMVNATLVQQVYYAQLAGSNDVLVSAIKTSQSPISSLAVHLFRILLISPSDPFVSGNYF